MDDEYRRCSRSSSNWRCGERAMTGKTLCEKHYLYAVRRSEQIKERKRKSDNGAGAELGDQKRIRNQQRSNANSGLMLQRVGGEDGVPNRDVGFGGEGFYGVYGVRNGGNDVLALNSGSVLRPTEPCEEDGGAKTNGGKAAQVGVSTEVAWNSSFLGHGGEEFRCQAGEANARNEDIRLGEGGNQVQLGEFSLHGEGIGSLFGGVNGGNNGNAFGWWNTEAACSGLDSRRVQNLCGEITSGGGCEGNQFRYLLENTQHDKHEMVQPKRKPGRPKGSKAKLGTKKLGRPKGSKNKMKKLAGEEQLVAIKVTGDNGEGIVQRKVRFEENSCEGQRVPRTRRHMQLVIIKIISNYADEGDGTMTLLGLEEEQHTLFREGDQAFLAGLAPNDGVYKVEFFKIK